MQMEVTVFHSAQVCYSFFLFFDRFGVPRWPMGFVERFIYTALVQRMPRKADAGTSARVGCATDNLPVFLLCAKPDAGSSGGGGGSDPRRRRDGRGRCGGVSSRRGARQGHIPARRGGSRRPPGVARRRYENGPRAQPRPPLTPRGGAAQFAVV
jgi:hypothetical protein